MKARLLVLFCVTTVAGLLLSGTPASAAADPLQPGDYMESSVGGCTLNFVYDGNAWWNRGRVYLGTAAHCVKGVGERIRDERNQAFGVVAFKGDGNSSAGDFAFIEVFGHLVGRVSPRVKGHSRYPGGGFTVASQTAMGDQLQPSGFGVGFDVTSTTRERRPAILNSDNSSTYAATGPFIFGDSGGPVVHIRSGRALGIVSRLCVGTCTQIGPTVNGILARASRAGFPVRLRTI